MAHVAAGCGAKRSDGLSVTSPGTASTGVDVTRWLVARYQHPDRLIRIEGWDDLPLQVTDR